MGQKIHPTGFRLPVTHAWASRWFANGKNFSQMPRASSSAASPDAASPAKYDA